MKLFRKKRDPNRELKERLGDFEIPTFPRVALQVLDKIRDPETGLDEIAEVLQWDPGLVVRLLRLVNSPAFGPRGEIRDVAHAAAYLGRAQLEQFVLALAVQDTLPSKPAPGFEPGRFWSAAARRAALGRLIADRLHPASQAESFTGGLLQDLAIPVIAHARPTEYGPVLCEWHADRGAELESLERDALGWTHPEVGGLLGEAWELPEGLVRSIANHHRSDCGDAELLPAVRLVAVLRETEAEHGLDALRERARSDYGLDPDWVAGAVAQSEELAGGLAGMLA